MESPLMTQIIKDINTLNTKVSGVEILTKVQGDKMNEFAIALKENSTETKKTSDNVQGIVFEVKGMKNDMKLIHEEIKSSNILKKTFVAQSQDHDTRLKLLENDKETRQNTKNSVREKVRGILWKIIEYFVVAIVLAIAVTVLSVDFGSAVINQLK